MFTVFRNEILKSSDSSGLTHQAIEHTGLSPQGEKLFTDCFYTPEKRSRCLLHISGVHGVEGYLGSLIQRQILSQTNFKDLSFQVVIVHAVNPYGMSHLLRTNGANVDLNRNSLPLFHIENPEYKNFFPFLQTGSCWDFLKTLPTIARIGVFKTVQAVACGQTEFPEAPFYAGHTWQPELRSLTTHLQSILDPQTHLYTLDVHTGLGSFGQETLILDGFDSNEERLFFEKAFQKATVTSGVSKNTYQVDGPFSQALKKHWTAFHVFEEFGTYPSMKVLNALIRRKPEQMLECFFPKNESWRQRCTDLGLLRFHQLVQTLS